MPLFVPSTLYYLSAALNVLTIPKHVAVGFRNIYPAVESIPPSASLGKPKHIIGPTWDYSNATLVALTAMNILWARKGGPSSVEEKWVLWTSVVGGAVVGWQYWRCKMYAGLGTLWGAPALSLAAMLWQRV
ncbi:uncharacterized protein J3D65DRAFT_668259 [Phyllosticta citribraziliensis]|uniref:Uncharacterized protein n=1 Tax=Phyllosticta citribraziliensis TaxID=989973 RepID=A0ABR1LKQ3_9PEZI